MQGVDLGVNFEQTRKMASFVTDYERGVLQAIVSGAINTKERQARHGARGVASPFCPFGQTCADLQVVETRLHRWWECPAWEHLRPVWFRHLRATLDEQPACFVQCAIAVVNYNGPCIDKVQKVFLEIQLAVNAADNWAAPDDAPSSTSSRAASCAFPTYTWKNRQSNMSPVMIPTHFDTPQIV